MLGFAQTEYFNPLDELGSGYGTRDIPAIKDHEINFPSSSQEVRPTNNSSKVNRKASYEEINNAIEQDLKAIEPDLLTKEETAQLIRDMKNKKITFEEYVNTLRNNTLAKQRIENNKNPQTNSYPVNNEDGKVVSFDTELTNFDRFENSPCYGEIGFSPAWDMNGLEQRYSECEKKHNINTTKKVLFGLAFILIIVAVIYFSLRKKRE